MKPVGTLESNALECQSLDARTCFAELGLSCLVTSAREIGAPETGSPFVALVVDSEMAK